MKNLAALTIAGLTMLTSGVVATILMVGIYATAIQRTEAGSGLITALVLFAIWLVWSLSCGVYRTTLRWLGDDAQLTWLGWNNHCPECGQRL